MKTENDKQAEKKLTLAIARILAKTDDENCSPDAESKYESIVSVYIMPFIQDELREIQSEAWKRRDKAFPLYDGEHNGHDLYCAGWGDCHCGWYPNPYDPDYEKHFENGYTGDSRW